MSAPLLLGTPIPLTLPLATTDMSPLLVVSSTPGCSKPVAPPAPIVTFSGPFSVVADTPEPAEPLTRPAPVTIVTAPAPVVLAPRPIEPPIAPAPVAIETSPLTFVTKSPAARPLVLVTAPSPEYAI